MKRGMREQVSRGHRSHSRGTRGSRSPRNVVGWSRQESVARRRGVQLCLGFGSSISTLNSPGAASFLLPDKLQRQIGSPHFSSTRGLKRQS